MAVKKPFASTGPVGNSTFIEKDTHQGLCPSGSEGGTLPGMDTGAGGGRSPPQGSPADRSEARRRPEHQRLGRGPAALEAPEHRRLVAHRDGRGPRRLPHGGGGGLPPSHLP